MKYKWFQLYVALFTLVSLFGCKKKDTPSNSENYRPLWEISKTFSEVEESINNYSKQGKSAHEALVLTSQALRDNASVRSTYHHDSSYLYITMNTGLEAVYALVPVDAKGNPIYRGAGGSSGTTLRRTASDECKEITNKKILLFNAEFSTNNKARAVLNENKEKFKLEVTELHKEECTYEEVSNFFKYGLVVLNTHGLPNGFLLGEQLPVTVQNSLTDLDAFAKNFNSDPKRSIADKILIDKQIGVVVTKHYDPKVPIHESLFTNADTIKTYISAKQVAQLNLNNTIVFGNMCYSGFDNASLLPASNIPILEAFRQAKTRTYYGYQQTAGMSHTVNSEVCESIEEQLYNGLFVESDSTGNAHFDRSEKEDYDNEWELFPTPGIKKFGNLYCRQFFAKDYCYTYKCPYNYYNTLVFQKPTGNEKNDATEWRLWTLVIVPALDSTKYSLEWKSHKKFLDPDNQDPGIVGRVVNWTIDDYESNKYVEFSPSPGGDKFEITGFEHVFWVQDGTNELEDVGKEFRKLVGQARVEFCPRGK